MHLTALKYDYNLLDPKIEQQAIKLTLEGKNYEKRSIEAIVGFGQIASKMQSLLPQGEFLKWLDVEFSLSVQMAYNFMHVAEKFGHMLPEIQDLPISLTVLYQLAEPTAPEGLTEQVLTKASAGEKVSVKEVKELKKQLQEEKEEKEQFETEVLDLLETQETLKREKDSLLKKIALLERQGPPVQTALPSTVTVVAPVVDTSVLEEVAELEKRLKELRATDKELTKRIAEKEQKSATFNIISGDPELKEKRIRLEQFRRKVISFFTDAVEEELLLSIGGMNEDLVEHYKALEEKFDSLSELCHRMITSFTSSKK